jgi:hypothetical protein
VKICIQYIQPKKVLKVVHSLQMRVVDLGR